MKRKNEIDILKTIAIFIVICIHVPVMHEYFIGDETATVVQYAFALIQAGVPIFVFVNGYLTIGKELSITNSIIKTAKIYLIFLIWCLIHLFFFASGSGLTVDFIFENMKTVAIGHPYLNILWFLVNLIQLYLFVPILRDLFISHKNTFYYLFIVIVFFLFVPKVLELAQYIFGSNFYVDCVVSHIKQFDFLKNEIFVFYAMLGAVVYDNREKMNHLIWVIAGIVSASLAFVFGFYVSVKSGSVLESGFMYSSFFLPLIVVAYYSLSCLISNHIINEKVNRVFNLVGANTLGIYLCHLLILVEIQQRILSVYSITLNCTLRVLLAMVVLVLSTIVTVVIKRIPIVNKLI